MKFVSFLIILYYCTSATLVYSQNGTYKCSSQGYSTVDKSQNKVYSDNQIITININDVFGGDITINNLSQDFILKYNIESNSKKTFTDKTERTITHTYLGKLVLSNVEMDEKLVIAVVESMDTSRVNIWISNEKYKSTNHHYNLTKLN